MRPIRLAAALLAPLTAFAADPLPSWNAGEAKSAILDFVAEAADPTAAGFVPEAERVAVFDHDGTLWSEQPVYVQFLFAMDRAAALAAADLGWAASPVLAAAAAGGDAALAEVIDATHAGLTVEAFQSIVADWIARARHPTTGRRYTEMVFQPMLELLDHLRANGFATYIVSGGGVDFMRAFAEPVYGVPPENVIGSMGDIRFETIDGVPQVMKASGIFFVDDEETKPVAIVRGIGRRPVFVAGNSDGDLAMAQWSTAGDGPRFALFVHHTDTEREWAYDRVSHIGRLDAALGAAAAAAAAEGWLVVDMAQDWNTVWPVR
jgi:phosphoglycolate phosphatase-like HAD superfamily hydrolase